MNDAFYESRMVSMNPGYEHVAAGPGLGNEHYGGSNDQRSVEEIAGVAAECMVAGALRGNDAARPLGFYVAANTESHGA
jgi:hypothetical protein